MLTSVYTTNTVKEIHIKLKTEYPLTREHPRSYYNLLLLHNFVVLTPPI